LKNAVLDSREFTNKTSWGEKRKGGEKKRGERKSIEKHGRVWTTCGRKPVKKKIRSNVKKNGEKEKFQLLEKKVGEGRPRN